MKNFTTLTFFLFAISAYCQINDSNRWHLPDEITLDAIYYHINNVTQSKLKGFCEKEVDIKNKDNVYYKASTNSAFLQQAKSIFNTVVIGNNDAINSGSAFAYSHDKDKHKFSANLAFAGKNWNSHLIDVGTSISSGDDSFEYYEDGKWANDISFKLGWNIRLFTSQYVMDTTCNNYNTLRKIAIAKKIDEIKEVVKLGKTSAELEADIKAYEKQILESLELKKITDVDYDKKLKKMYEQLKLLKKIEYLMDPSKVKPEVAQVWTSIYRENDKFKNRDVDISSYYRDVVTQTKVEKFAEELLTDFDKKNNPFHGYFIVWFNTHLRLTNSSFKLEGQDLINSDLQEIYQSRLKSTLEISGNINKLTLNSIQFFKLYAGLNQISYLDSPNLIGENISIQPTFSNSQPFYNIVDEDGNIIDSYENIRDWKYSMDIGVNYTNLWMFDRTLGLTGRASVNFSAFKNIGMLYDKNYSLTGGAVFRMASQDKFSAATFMLTGGVERQLYDTNGWDRFVLKASIGVPFSIFEKSKKESK